MSDMMDNLQPHEIDKAFDMVWAATNQLRTTCTRAEVNLDHKLIAARIKALRAALDDLAKANALKKHRQAA